MKKMFALLMAAMLLCGVAAAETVDAYTTASNTKTVLSGKILPLILGIFAIFEL